MIEPALVLSVALLSLADDAGEFFNRVEVRRRRRPLDQAPVVAFAPAAQLSEHDPLFASKRYR